MLSNITGLITLNISGQNNVTFRAVKLLYIIINKKEDISIDISSNRFI